MAARRADPGTGRSAGEAPFPAQGGRDPAPPGISFQELREAIQAVIGSVDKLRDEVLPDICGKLRSIESSTHAARGAASREPSDAAPSSKQPPCSTVGGPGAVGGGWGHAGGQADELRDVVGRLHERLEERMQAMYRQHSTQWEERLQALLGGVRREHHPPVVPPLAIASMSGNDLAGRSPRSSSPRDLAGRSPRSSSPRSSCLGHWRDLRGSFFYGRAVVIAEEGWHPLEPWMSEFEPAAANPVEFLSNSRCKLLLSAGEASSQWAPLYAELGPSGSLVVTPVDDARGGASFTLARVGVRRRLSRLDSDISDGQRSRRSKRESNSLEDGSSGLSLGAPLGRRHSLPRWLASVNLQSEWAARWQLKKRKRGRLGCFLTRRYELAQVSMILLDAIVLACRTQYAAESLAGRPYESARGGIGDHVVLVLLNDFFCLWFTLDLACRALAEGKYFFRPAVLLSRSFEVFIVAGYILDAIAMHAHYDEGSKSLFRFWVGFMSFARTLRLLRLVFMSKLVRHSNAFRELRMMMYALKGAMKSLAWSIVVLMVILLISGTVLTNGYLRFIVYNEVVLDGRELLDYDRYKEVLLLRDSFGTLFESMFTLLETVTGGKDWGEVYLALHPMSWPYKVFYVLFQIFATLALLNVITAVFVESTMQRSARDREAMVIDEMAARKELLAKINALFEDFDEDKDGLINREELKEKMQNKHISAYFSSLGVDVDQVGKLFVLLDQDNSGTIDRAEFLRGCSRLKGDAKSVDLAVLQSDVDLLVQDMEELSRLARGSAAKIDLLFEPNARPELSI